MEQNNNVYPNNPYPCQPVAVMTKKEDSVFTKRLRQQYPYFGIGSAVYALFYTFCLYKNASGITYPFFVAGTLCYFFFSIQKLGVPYKRDSLFYIAAIVLLGASNCLTASTPLLLMNKCGIFLLTLILMLHTVYADGRWNLPKYLGAVCTLIGTAVSCLLRPLSDMVFYFDAQKQGKPGKKNYTLPILAGVSITVPLLFVTTLLLASADAVFLDITKRFLQTLDVANIFGVLALTVVVFFCSYAVYAGLSMKNISEDVRDLRTWEPVTAIIITAALSVLYLMFSVIQILYLFIGRMQLPAGYTYASYAREGFFQLLAVCVLNLALVLICLHLFRENTVLKAILTVISACTFIMILSSALRMLMYINRYNLTFLRVFVLWALAVIFLLMAGVTVSIYMERFPLFTYSVAIVTVCYIGLSFAHPDYWIAKYNLSPAHLEYLDDYDVFDNKRYLCGLSADAAPVLLDEQKNPYLHAGTETENDAADYSDIARYSEQGVTEDLDWLGRYCGKITALREDMYLRNFNFSVYTAGRYLR